MNVIYFLVPMALLLVGVLVWAFWWAIRSGQFDDLEGPAWSILMDDDEPGPPGSRGDTEGPGPPPGRTGDDGSGGSGGKHAVSGDSGRRPGGERRD